MVSPGDTIIYRAIDEVDRRGLIKLRPAMLEKDFMVTKVLGLLASFNWANHPFTAVFCGGTALSKGHKLIQHYQSHCPSDEALLPEVKLEFILGSTFFGPMEIQVKSLLSEILECEEVPILHQALKPEETMVEKVVAFLHRTAGWVEDGWPQKERIPEDERLVRHLYDVQQLLQQTPPNPEVKATHKRLFEKVVEGDRQQFRGEDEAFASGPSQRLVHALAQLHTYSADFANLYQRFVSRLVWGPAVEFSIAQAAFARLAGELLDANTMGAVVE